MRGLSAGDLAGGGAATGWPLLGVAVAGKVPVAVTARRFA